MTRDELIKRLGALTIEAMKERDTLAAAGVLSALIGALCERTDDALMSLTARFSEDALRGLRAREN